MTKEEYIQKLGKIEIEYKNKKYTLGQEFAMSNNPYKVGDILQDHSQIIQIKNIKWGWRFGSINIPECVYLGVQLTGKLKPKKKQDTNSRMYQSNVLRKLN